MRFIDEAGAAQMRVRVLNELSNILGEYPSAVISEFTVTRTNDRKGYRDERPYVNDLPYQSEPKTKVMIEVEVDDDATPGFKDIVNDIIDIEREDARRAKGLRLRCAELRLQVAQAEYEAAKSESVDE